MFTTKKYTRPVLRKELRKVKTIDFYNMETLANAISPRAGTDSAKMEALRNFVGSDRTFRKLFSLTSHVTKEQLLTYLK